MSAPQNRTMENPAQERQNEVRNRVLKKAQIVFKGRGAAIDCAVLNLADRSACLKVESPIGIPNSFDLVLDHASVGNCRVTWRKATQIGVEFVPSTTVDKHLALRAAHEAERLRRSADHLARAQRIAHTGSIEQDLRTGVIEWSGETYRIFGLDPNLPRPSGKLSLISSIPTIAPRVKRRRSLTKPRPRAGFPTCRALPSAFASSSLAAR